MEYWRAGEDLIGFEAVDSTKNVDRGNANELMETIFEFPESAQAVIENPASSGKKVDEFGSGAHLFRKR